MVRRLHISRARFQSHFKSRYGAGCFSTLGAGYTFSRAWLTGYPGVLIGPSPNRSGLAWVCSDWLLIFSINLPKSIGNP